MEESANGVVDEAASSKPPGSREGSTSVCKKKTIFGSKKIVYEEVIRSMRTQCSSMTSEYDFIIANLRLSEAQLSNRLALALQMQAMFRDCGKIGTAKVILFGSSINNLGFQDCDIDLRLELDDIEVPQCLRATNSLVLDQSKVAHHFNKTIKSKDQKAFAQRLSELSGHFNQRFKDTTECIRKFLISHDAFSDVSSYCTSKRDCLVKFKFAAHPVELSIATNDLALLNTTFIERIFSLNQQLCTLATLMNFVAKASHHFMSTKLSRISSYSVFCLTLACIAELDPGFSQKIKKLLTEMNKKIGLKESCDQILTAFQWEPSVSTKKLFSQILSFLSNLDYSIYVFSPLLGGVVPYTRLFIPQCAEYFNLAELNIQDPFEPNRNISTKVCKMSAWRKEFQRVHQKFEKKHLLHNAYIDLFSMATNEPKTVTSSSSSKATVSNLVEKEKVAPKTSFPDLKKYSVVHILIFKPNNSKRKNEFSVEDFKEWACKSLRGLATCFEKIYHCEVLNGEEILNSIVEKKITYDEIVWPFYLNCVFKRDVWRGRRKVKEKLSGKAATTIEDEMAISQELFNKRTDLLQIVFCVLKMNASFKDLFLKIDVLTEAPPDLKKAGLCESLDTLLMSLYKRLNFENI